MSAVAAVDPGIRGCGVAVFSNGRLIVAAYVRSPVKSGCDAAAAAAMGEAVAERLPCLGELALEWPRVYASRIREGRSKADPNDLLALCGVQAVVAARCRLPSGSVRCYAPSDWKGQMPKGVCGLRVRSRLDPVELGILDDADCPPSLMHNVLDAVGIGLHHVGRRLR